MLSLFIFLTLSLSLWLLILFKLFVKNIAVVTVVVNGIVLIFFPAVANVTADVVFVNILIVFCPF